MTKYTLKNDDLVLQFNELGAELCSIYDPKTETEYIWNANPEYWKRHAPILFPFVGSLKNKSYTYKGQTYHVAQHGFARDMDFSLLKSESKEIWFVLHANEQTKKIYPFDFRLELGYRLEGRCITVLWKVINDGSEIMYFSIGGHPAFCCPLNPKEKQSDYFLSFDTNEPIRYLLIDENGLAEKKPATMQELLITDQGTIPINQGMFDHDALIIEDHQCHKISLLTPSRQSYLTVTFDAPLFGLWSPAGKEAPFVCIEPWYGRCDASDFEGSLENREWGNSLQPGEIFEAEYTIEVD